MADNNQPRKGSGFNQEIPGSVSIFDDKGRLRKGSYLISKRKEAIKKELEIKDMQDAVTRYKWTNIPLKLTSEEIERFLYLKGSLAFFQFKDEEFYLMPYALDGTIDFYGRFNQVHPVPMAEGNEKVKKKHLEGMRNLLSQLKLEVIKVKPEEDEKLNPEKVCVILNDYGKIVTEIITPRRNLQDAIIDVESECIPYMRTALKNSTGVLGVRVTANDEQGNVNALNSTLDAVALEGSRYVGVVGQIDFQELTGGTVGKAQDFMQAMQSIDNYRLSLYGISNGGVFEKKAHMLDQEQDMNESQNAAQLQEGLNIRKNFCEVVNAIWNLNLSVEINPEVKHEEAEEDPMNDEEQGGEGNDEQ